MLILHLLFWSCVATLVYVYLGYPALVWAWARYHPRPLRRGEAQPSVSVLVVAQNEAATIQSRIENLLALDYPRDRLEIFVASDGSTDGTPELARAYERTGVRVVTFRRRRGKASALNNLAH